MKVRFYNRNKHLLSVIPWVRSDEPNPFTIRWPKGAEYMEVEYELPTGSRESDKRP